MPSDSFLVDFIQLSAFNAATDGQAGTGHPASTPVSFVLRTKWYSDTSCVNLDFTFCLWDKYANHPKILSFFLLQLTLL